MELLCCNTFPSDLETTAHLDLPVSRSILDRVSMLLQCSAVQNKYRQYLTRPAGRAKWVSTRDEFSANSEDCTS